jgi:hypothetical protein
MKLFTLNILFHPILINPAYSGFKTNHELLFNYKNTASTFPGAPKTYTASFNGPVGTQIGDLVRYYFNDVVGDLSKFQSTRRLSL